VDGPDKKLLPENQERREAFRSQKNSEEKKWRSLRDGSRNVVKHESEPLLKLAIRIGMEGQTSKLDRLIEAWDKCKGRWDDSSLLLLRDAQDFLRDLIRKLEILVPDAQTEGAGKPKAKEGGRKRTEESDPIKAQVYDRIFREHQPGRRYAETVTRLKDDKQFMEQIREAELKLDETLVKNALACLRQPGRKQETRN
jgi:hypothetical protein